MVKSDLLAKLKQEHCSWSYNVNSIKDTSDDMLIEKTMLHPDLDEINQLFLIFPFRKIKIGVVRISNPSRRISIYIKLFFLYGIISKLKDRTYHTQQVFEAVSKLECIKPYIIVGDTALSLQIETRQSEDFDFMKWQTCKDKKLKVDWFQIEKGFATIGKTQHKDIEEYIKTCL